MAIRNVDEIIGQPVTQGAMFREYAYNSSATTSSDLTSFASGQQGINFQAFAPSGNTGVQKRVQFSDAIQAGDTFVVETDGGSSGARWQPFSDRYGSRYTNDANTVTFNYDVTQVSSTQVDVSFYSAIGGGIAWSAITGHRWRVKRERFTNGLNVGPGAQPMYVYNSSTSITTDTTSFASGAQGVSFTAMAPGVSSSVVKRVRFPYPPVGSPVLKIIDPNNPSALLDFDHRIGSFGSNAAGSQYWGARVTAVAGSTTDFDVQFFNTFTQATGDTWSGLASFKWVVVAANPTSPVGFGAASATAAGLISSEQSTVLTTTVAGATTTPTITVRQTKIGRLVNLTVSPSGLLTKNGANGRLTFTIDPEYRPTSILCFMNLGVINNASSVVYWNIGSSGLVEMYNSSGGTNIPANQTFTGWDQDLSFTYAIR